MGVLDDAIREHLELKRRHGASEEEVARKEAEALGPARRGPAAEEPVAVATPGDDAVASSDVPPSAVDDPYEAVEPPGAVAGPDEVEAATGPSMADAAAALGEGVPVDTVPEPEVAAEPEPDVPVAHTEPLPEDEPLPPAPIEPTIDVPAEPEPPAAIEPAAEPVGADHPPVHDIDRDPLEPPPPITSQGTVEFDSLAHREEDEEPVAAEAGDEDVLEETPEFLRETPEHDRLWFEQKPPRDFDLDN
jgi:hypothetical protein